MDPLIEQSAAPLSEFVRLHCRSGTSFRQLAELSVDPETGDSLDFRWINALAHDRLANAPTPQRLRALAAGIGIPVELLKRLAAAQWLDFRVGPDRPRFGLPELWSRLSDADRETLQIVAQCLMDRQNRTNDTDL